MSSFIRIATGCLIASLFGFVMGGEAQARVLVVNFSTATLSLYADDETLLARFPAVVPLKAEEPKKLPVRGVVKKVDLHPYWYPTERTRRYFLEKRKILLPATVPPNDPNNMLGTIRIVVYFIDPNKLTARIHGTTEPHLIFLPAEKRHRSGGCIRLLNADAEKLAALIQAGADPVRVLYIRE
jgi:lipoprotein-anchoring transpeptidase ErfK/SrfK